jgi:3-hydroxyacyl-CoA dehydrogenase
MDETAARDGEAQTVATTIRDGTAILTIDNPPVNALSHRVRVALAAALRAAERDAAIDGIVIACAGRTFAAGADIAEFGAPAMAPTLRDLLALLDGLATPTVAALHGNALGGGLELALCCRYRIATPETQLGLPEIRIGLIPGAGGTVRLPYLVGPLAAFEMMADGAPIAAGRAAEIGLVDALAADPVAEAVAFLRRVGPAARPRIGTDRTRIEAADPAALAAASARVERRARGLEAPLALLAAMRNTLALPFAEALAEERVLFDRLVAGEQSKALRHLFFAERKAARLAVPAVPREIVRVGVVGAGTMGTGIAMAFANAGLPVTIVEVSPEALERGRRAIGTTYGVSIERGSTTAADAAERQSRLSFTTQLEQLSDCDLIVEAAFEEMAVKQELFQRLDAIARKGAILATNTSYLDVDVIAAATDRPRDVVGLHFFSPANVMKLLEVVKARATADDVIATAVTLGKRLGKTPVVVGVCHGFVGNRMLGARSEDMIDLLVEGATPASVDAAFEAFGWPMGPFRMQDLAGLDIGWRNRRALGRSLAIADELCVLGRFGQKTGRGYYRYTDGSRAAQDDDEVLAMIRARSAALGIERRAIPAEEIIERTHFPLVNEGARLIGEGIAARASDIDVVWTNGFGFPRHKGGPMYWARSIGIDRIISRLEHWHARGGKPVFEPCRTLRDMASGPTLKEQP